jgi:hypothetical protein
VVDDRDDVGEAIRCHGVDVQVRPSTRLGHAAAPDVFAASAVSA